MPTLLSRKKRFILGGLFVFFLLATLLSSFAFVKTEEKKEEEVSSSVLLPEIAVYCLIPKELDESINTYGSIMFCKKVEVYGKVEERIKKIYVDVGDRVLAGKMLAEAENESLRIQVDLAREEATGREATFQLSLAKLDKAKEEVERNMENLAKLDIDIQQKQVEVQRYAQILSNQRVLAEIEGISREKLREAEANFLVTEMSYKSLQKQRSLMEIGFREIDVRKQGFFLPKEKTQQLELFQRLNTKIEQSEVAVAESEKRKAMLRVKEAELLYNETFIRSPINGVVIMKNIDVGQKINRETPLFILADIDKIYIELPIPESDLVRIAEGQQVFFTVDAYRGEKFLAKIDRIYPTIDLKTRTVTVRAIANNSRRGKGYKLLPGMFVRASVVTRKKRDSYSIPMKAVGEIRDGRARIYVVSLQGEKQGIVRETWVPLRYVGETYVEIEPVILQAGTLIAMSGLDFLYTGIKVAISNTLTNIE